MNITSHNHTTCAHHGAAGHRDVIPALAQEEADSLKDLFTAAVEAHETAYAPNSQFKVGAAILTRDGSVYKGSNKEFTINADHAEQRAINEALVDGQTPEDFVAVGIFGARGEVTEKNFQTRLSPCGNCRQALHELNPDMLAVGAKGVDAVQAYRLGDELPDGYHRKRDLPKPPEAKLTGDPLTDGALKARSTSYVPRSQQPVGAAVETNKGIFIGTRAEVSSFTSQAARMALGAAVEAGATVFHRLAIVGGSQAESMERPQNLPFDTFEALYRLAPEAEVVLPDDLGQMQTYKAGEFPKFLMN